MADRPRKKAKSARTQRKPAGDKPKRAAGQSGRMQRKAAGGSRTGASRPVKSGSKRMQAASGTGKHKPVAKQGSDRKKKRPSEVSKAKTNEEPSGGSGRAKAKGKGGGGTRRAATISLALKFTAPVVALIVLIIFLWGAFLGRSVDYMLINDIKKDGVSAVNALAAYGETILKQKQNLFLAAQPTEEGGKTPVVNWPVKLNLISESRFKAAMSLPEGQELTQNHINQAAPKQPLLKWFSYLKAPGSGEGKATQVLSAYLFEGDSLLLTSEGTAGGSVKSNNWLTATGRFQDVRFGDEVVDVKAHGGITIYPAILERGDERIKVFAFTKELDLGGRALLALRADVILEEQSKISTMMYGIGGGAILLAILICVGLALFVTAPIKTLIHDMEVVAKGNLDHKTRAHSNDEIGQIAAEFNEMTRRLAIARNAEKEAERLENELDMAREIQMRLLPSRVPQVKGFDIYAFYKPAKEVGGDYYDFIPIDKEHLGIIVADVSGKGIPGSMVMATTRTILRFVASGNLSAADTLARTNSIVATDIKRGMFVTAFYIMLDARNKKILCASAGHNPMAIVRADGTLEQINPNGIALGFDKGPIFQRTIKEQEIGVGSGDRLVIYTDGVVEAMNLKNEEYSDERFYKFCQDHRDLDSKQFTEALLADLDKHKGKAEQHDDITIVTLKVQ